MDILLSSILSFERLLAACVQSTQDALDNFPGSHLFRRLSSSHIEDKMPFGSTDPLDHATTKEKLMLQPQPGPDGYITFPCGAAAGGPYWNRIALPVGWVEVEIYVTDILWNDGNNDVTNLDQTGDHAILVANVGGENRSLNSESTNPQHPSLLTIVQSGQFAQLLFSATNDNPVSDNYGGYVLRVRQAPPGSRGVRLK